ncbi:MAG: hypothetical protein JXB49_06555 [Bacteroidales bacterium]|nr:hypothetical protein [Bacteroidales bacterium]
MKTKKRYCVPGSMITLIVIILLIGCASTSHLIMDSNSLSSLNDDEIIIVTRPDMIKNGLNCITNETGTFSGSMGMQLPSIQFHWNSNIKQKTTVRGSSAPTQRYFALKTDR